MLLISLGSVNEIFDGEDLQAGILALRRGKEANIQIHRREEACLVAISIAEK